MSNPGLSWRRESFGALCYSFAKRDLFMITSTLAPAVLDEFAQPKSRSEVTATLRAAGASASVISATIDALCAKSVLIVASPLASGHTAR